VIHVIRYMDYGVKA